MGEDKVTGVVLSAIRELNETREKDEQVGAKLDTLLFGDRGALDSLGLVNLVTLIEQKAEDDLGVTIALADERAFNQPDSPFRTVGSLIQYVALLVKENG